MYYLFVKVVRYMMENAILNHIIALHLCRESVLPLAADGRENLAMSGGEAGAFKQRLIR